MPWLKWIYWIFRTPDSFPFDGLAGVLGVSVAPIIVRRWVSSHEYNPARVFRAQSFMYIVQLPPFRTGLVSFTMLINFLPAFIYSATYYNPSTNRRDGSSQLAPVPSSVLPPRSFGDLAVGGLERFPGMLGRDLGCVGLCWVL